MRRKPFAAVLLALLTAGCITPRATAGVIEVTVSADSERFEVSVPAGSTVQNALDISEVVLDELDRVDPPGYAVVTDGTMITVVRRVEQFEVEELTLPFSSQTIRNEGLPEGETRLLQPGQNGLEEITYRIVLEEGEEISRQAVKRSVVVEPKPEIIMIGAQAAYTPLALKGSLAYLTGGNAWVMQGNSGNRRPVVVSGDLDGQVFRVSPDGRWLLFSRRLEDEQDFNALWIVDLEATQAEPIDLDVRNVVHFADWSPDPGILAYSTVEPRQSAPGWQANNDLVLLTLSARGRVLRERQLLAPNPGGQYGWWGTSFMWAPDGIHLAYAQADGIGLVDTRDAEFEPIYEIVPLVTGSDWAWVPGLAWGSNSRTLYLVDHAAPIGIEDATASPAFDLVALSSPGASSVPLVARSGMFAYPSVSPSQIHPSGEISNQVAFLQAIAPLASESSSYRLMVMDRDGSNLRSLFPEAGQPGIAQGELAPPVWSPDGNRVALVYRGDVWIIDVATGAGQQLTGDGLATTLDWK
jgi:Tol biopolymer transport system component